MHVHEQGGDNTGPRVIQYQSAAGGGTHWAWCDAFCDFCFQEAGRPLEELQKSASVMTSYRDAKAKGWIVETPQRGDLVCFQWDTGDFDHIGFVVQPMPDGSIKTVEGNTSAMPGEGHAQGEGDGVFVKIRPRSVCGAFIRVPGNVAIRSRRPASTTGRSGSGPARRASGPMCRSRCRTRGGPSSRRHRREARPASPGARQDACKRGRRPLAYCVASRRRVCGGGRHRRRQVELPRRARAVETLRRGRKAIPASARSAGRSRTGRLQIPKRGPA